MTVRRTASLASVADLLASLSREARPLEPERLPLEEAVGGVLSEPLAVEIQAPREAAALRPGYAVASSALVGVSPYAPLMLPDEPPWVEAGGALPAGTDAVLPPDAVMKYGSSFEIVAGLSPGENVVRAGEDAPSGAVLRDEGEILRLQDVAIARAAGLRHAAVRRPRIGFVISHSGAVDPRTASLVMGIDGVISLVSPEKALESTGSEIDLLVVASHDATLAERLLARAERIVAHGIALRPGEMTQVALQDGRPIVILPPRLDALFAVARCVLRPYLRQLAGARPDRVRRLGPLGRKLSSTIGFTEVALLRDSEQGVDPLGVGTLPLPALAKAQYWLALPPESEGHQAGTMIDALDI